jgi:hypothetical protein
MTRTVICTNRSQSMDVSRRAYCVETKAVSDAEKMPLIRTSCKVIGSSISDAGMMHTAPSVLSWCQQLPTFADKVGRLKFLPPRIHLA